MLESNTNQTQPITPSQILTHGNQNIYARMFIGVNKEVSMKFKNLVLSLCLLAVLAHWSTISWIEEERQANYEQCRRNCNGVFAGSNQHYDVYELRA